MAYDFNSDPRLTFYNPAVDGEGEYPGTCEMELDKQKANLVGSLCDDGMHMPALDIDLPCRLVPSTTEGHFHLYIDKPMFLETYRKLVEALVEAGIVEGAWVDHLERNKMTTLRLPGRKKPRRATSSGQVQ